MATPEKENLSTKELLTEIHKDVGYLREELVGNKEFQRKGIIERVKDLENKRWKEIIASSGIGGIIGGTLVYLALKLGIFNALKYLAGL